MMVDDMAAAGDPRGGHMAGVAPTGSGKSLAALSVAAVGAARYEERWVISTESLSLQSQYVDKDGPVIQKASKDVLGVEPRIAVLKGWSNYACMLKAQQTMRETGVAGHASDLKRIAKEIRKHRPNPADTIHVDGRQLNAKRLFPLLAWVAEQHIGPNPGDKASYEGIVTDDEWSTVSVSTQECVGENACPLASICRPIQARQKVSEADIIITNHAMLAVQAATGAPVVIGNQKVGPLHGIVVDEAHALPGAVRSQGQSSISARRLTGVITRVRDAAGRKPDVEKWADDGDKIIDVAQHEIAAAAAGSVPADIDPLPASGDVVKAWLSKGMKLAGTTSSDLASVITSRRAQGYLEKVIHDLDQVREHRVGVARWWEPAPPHIESKNPAAFASVQSAPVQVAKMIEYNLWSDHTPPVGDGPEDEVTDIDDAEVDVSASGHDSDDDIPSRPLTVACLSATLPDGFIRDAGLKTQVRSYPSPFDDAYANSMLFVAKAADDADIQAVSVSRYGKPKFDVKRHAEWAAAGMIRLANANQGSALVLAATAANGRMYAARLKDASRGRWRVYSQWDGEPIPQLVRKWRDDHGSILVGTKSMMTGVDAPGETNTLVMVDRAPRAASNPVDDARVEVLTEALGDKWSADRLVYVSDAKLLLEQALGRLIRHTTDTGLAAVFDPRMLNAGPFKYQTPTRNAYQGAMARFPNKTTSIEDAEQWIKSRKVKRAA